MKVVSGDHRTSVALRLVVTDVRAKKSEGWTEKAN